MEKMEKIIAKPDYLLDAGRAGPLCRTVNSCFRLRRTVDGDRVDIRELQGSNAPCACRRPRRAVISVRQITACLHLVASHPRRIVAMQGWTFTLDGPNILRQRKAGGEEGG